LCNANYLLGNFFKSTLKKHWDGRTHGPELSMVKITQLYVVSHLNH
jgi:hypothetical protein